MSGTDTKQRELPSHLVEELTNPPTHERHQWLFWCAVRLLKYRSQDVVIKLLRTASSRVGRYVPDREINAAVSDALRWRTFHGSAATPLQKVLQAELRWPAPDLGEVDQLVRGGPRRLDLQSLTKERFSPDTRHTEQIIDRLYLDNPLLCCAKESWQFATRRREIWRGRLAGLPLLVPSPMSAVYGRTDDGTGHWSEHSLANTGPRQYLVVEFDFTVADDTGHPTIWATLIQAWEKDGITIGDACTALLWYLGRSAPLLMVVFSGGKSLHGWFPCAGEDETQLRRWMAQAVRIGACQSTWTRSQFVRMPDGTRENGKRQGIEYFNAGVIS